MTQYFNYKGYQGTVEPQIEDGTLYGKLAFIGDLVTYEADTMITLEQEFRRSVDDYLADCAALGKEPDKPFKGVLNVRLGAELHRKIGLLVNNRRGKSVNAFICDAVREKLSRIDTEDTLHHHR
ncbi:type II toxin-antitoxin system HicB family antitoxin [Endozoicomonas sp. SCSIO W0465]|uniref:type II toxin-antitoxin system HicB family antitoxin n=1 Tax=Endozoicomonas sp. SCSIO W0465 TaxID=2918516 RepID=UPI002075FB88|nr:type II toxin-antitoxin system HicB family antitoxin [Endozoicomonas sp. SCSIO W0465]USE39213.1 type II toxin-antitoxin system HicB family antitoxin [Endozoicomonas sp. SCSIO W0465]